MGQLHISTASIASIQVFVFWLYFFSLRNSDFSIVLKLLVEWRFIHFSKFLIILNFHIKNYKISQTIIIFLYSSFLKQL